MTAVNGTQGAFTVTDTDQHNGQHEGTDLKPEPSPAMTAAQRKEQMARESEELRAMFVSERDQLNAERAELWERVKVLNAEIKNIDETRAKVTKVVKAAGAPVGSRAAATAARANGRK
jgi:hypothetical protein